MILDFNGTDFILLNKQTACLTQDSCRIPKKKLNLNTNQNKMASTCRPGGGCC